MRDPSPDPSAAVPSPAAPAALPLAVLAWVRDPRPPGAVVPATLVLFSLSMMRPMLALPSETDESLTGSSHSRFFYT
jgi:hypothetical protein